MVGIGVAAGVVAALAAVLIPWLPTSASEEMDRISFVYWFATVISIAIFAIVTAVIVYSVLKFRARPDDESDGPPIHGHTGLEIVWTAIPAILVMAIVVVSAIVLARNDNVGTNPVRVDVVAQQFAWKFEYPGSGVTSGRLVLPVGRSARLELDSLDVIHSFWVPEFGQKQDAVPGIPTRLVITPNRLGTFPVICAELCGLGHATMRSEVEVVTADAFDAWLAEQKQASGGGGGASVFTAQGCGACHAFKPAGSTAQVGPSLDAVAQDAQAAGVPVPEFVRESIVDPDKYLNPGYAKGGMPKTFAALPQDQLDALVEYVVGGKGS
ncbi:MAG: cytochrome c oxidase subunit II [Actinobacteria bacterium]|nr:cytochrome c oxidase subunit II [Actinomycetota bacterium]